MVILLAILSVVAYFIIELPPGNYLDILLAQMEANGFLNEEIIESTVEQLHQQYGFDRPVYVRYFIWISGFVRGDMGRSFIYNEPVQRLIGERIVLTMMISIPGAKGQRRDEMAQPVDIFPTVCDFLGVEQPSQLEGASLMPVVGTGSPDGATASSCGASGARNVAERRDAQQGVCYVAVICH